MSKNQQLIKTELEKLGHTGVKVEWKCNRYYYNSDQRHCDWGFCLRGTLEETLENIGAEGIWIGGDEE